jgi:hypothetical protein
VDKYTFDLSYLASQWCLVVASTIVAVVAIFGDSIRERIYRPVLKIRLVDVHGESVLWNLDQRGIYYHLVVENHGRGTARDVRVICQSISKKKSDGSFELQHMEASERLMWRFSQTFGITRDIPSGYFGKLGEVCDFGVVNEGGSRFSITQYAATASFPGYLEANQSMRVNLFVGAQNVTSKIPYCLDVSWDGMWTSDLTEMAKHLVLTEIGC